LIISWSPIPFGFLPHGTGNAQGGLTFDDDNSRPWAPIQ
jgi:hypothetical protein